LVEGSGALSVAAFLKHNEQGKGQNVVFVLSGSQLSLKALREVLRD
jgi:threonine dehydratase